MGNKVDKTYGGRGQALGSSADQPPKTKRTQKRAPSHPQRVQHSKEEQRAARSKLVQKKQINVQSELNKKEKMLHIMEAADAVAHGQKAPTAPKCMQHDDESPSKSVAKTQNKTQNVNESSIYMADPSSKEARAAEQRIQQKARRSKNTEERKNRTLDLLFGDGLKINEDERNDGNDASDQNNNKNTKSTSNIYKSDKNIPLSSDSKTASAALARLNQQKNNRVVSGKDRKQRTMKLMHGDLLKDENEVKAAPRQSAYDDDLDPEIAAVHQSILNLNNCNPHEKMPATAKLLRKVVTNLLSAETKQDQDKFGKLRLSNKKIKAAFVDMEYGVETLESLGFTKKKIYNDKEHKMDDYMLFDFSHINHKALCHVMDLLNEYYPDA